MLHVLIIFILILFNAFFSLSEVALISARKTRLASEAKHGSRAAQMALDLQSNPDLFLSTAQIGITIVSILTGIYSGASLSADFSGWLISLGLSQQAAAFVAPTAILILATYLQCELGELFPKRIGIDMADAAARLCAPPMIFFARITKPFVWLLTQNTQLLVRLFHLKKEANVVTEDEIKSVIQEGTESGEVQEVEQDIMERTLALGNLPVSTLMTYRTDIVTLDAGMQAPAVEDVIRDTPFANYPVVDGDMEHVIGFISLKDLVMRLYKPDFSLRTNLQKPIYLPETISVYKALEHLKKVHYHVAIICDELGAITGILTFRDIFEGLVGNIQDQTEDPDIIERKDGNSWVVSGQCSFLDFLDYFDESTDLEPDFNTIAGLVLRLLDRIPKVGDTTHWQHFDLRVVEMDGNRIDKLLVTRRQPEAAKTQPDK